MSSPPRPPASAARSRGSGAGRSPGWRLGSNRHQPDVGRGQIAERQDAGTKPGTNEDALVPIADIAAGETAAIARDIADRAAEREANLPAMRSEEHTAELQSLMRISYAVFCLKKKLHNKK